MPKEQERSGFPERDRAGLNIVWIVGGVIVLAVIYYAATSYWAPPPETQVMYVCPEGYAYLKRDDICVPGAEPVPQQGIAQ